MKVGNMTRASQIGGLKAGHLIIGSQTKVGLSFSTVADPVVHTTMGLAKAEAARLATNDKTKKYVVLEVKAVASTNDVNWE